ncbi:MAG: family 4 glycosyl hydrolase [Nocardioidaceae bacterium]
MSRIKMVYIGAGSTRAPGTIASVVQRHEQFSGSEIALVDPDREHLSVTKQLGDNLAKHLGADVSVTIPPDQRSALEDADIVLASFRPGGFEARVIDETVPLKYDCIGEETQGPGGFFMALRSINAFKSIVDDIAAVAPNARIVNFTNPVNIVAQAVSDHTDIPVLSLCEGPMVCPESTIRAAGLDPERAETFSIGLNHGSWSVVNKYDGQDNLIDLIRESWQERAQDPTMGWTDRKILQLTAMTGLLPSHYFQYYYFEREMVSMMKAKPQSRGADLLEHTPTFWEHYKEEAAKEVPQLDPQRSRGAIYELDFALDVVDSIVNDRGRRFAVNAPNNGSVPGFDDDLVMETEGTVDKDWVHTVRSPELPRRVRGLVEKLAEYQRLTAEAAWSGDRRDGINALLSHPLVRELNTAEQMYDEMAGRLGDLLPDRLRK